MEFKAKTFKLGNSRAVYIPRDVYTTLEEDKVYTFKVLDVYTEKDVYTPEKTVGVPKVKSVTKSSKPFGKMKFNLKKGVWE